MGETGYIYELVKHGGNIQPNKNKAKLGNQREQTKGNEKRGHGYLRITIGIADSIQRALTSRNP